MTLASAAPSASSAVLRSGVPATCPWMQMPPATVYSANSTTTNGTYSRSSACTAWCHASPGPWSAANGTSSAAAHPPRTCRSGRATTSRRRAAPALWRAATPRTACPTTTTAARRRIRRPRPLRRAPRRRAGAATAAPSHGTRGARCRIGASYPVALRSPARRRVAAAMRQPPPTACSRRVERLPHHDPATVAHEHAPTGIAHRTHVESEDVAVERRGPVEIPDRDQTNIVRVLIASAWRSAGAGNVRLSRCACRAFRRRCPASTPQCPRRRPPSHRTPPVPRRR